MKKWVCPVCGYVHEGENPPEFCPVCKVPGSKFTEQAGELTWAAEHVVGVGKQFGADVPADVQEQIIAGLRSNFEGECSEVGMYLAMARVAYREGYPEVGLYWEKAGTCRCASTPRTAPPPARPIWPSSARSTTWTPCTTPSMRWPATRPATAKPSRACWIATLSKKSLRHGAPFGAPRNSTRKGRNALAGGGILRKEKSSMKYVCNVCGWVYDEDEAGVKWEDLPDDFACELCGVGKDEFSPEE